MLGSVCFQCSVPSAFSGCVATQVAKRGQEATKGTGAMGQWGRAVKLTCES